MSSNNGIPFLDLVSLHAEIKEELTAVFRTVLDTAGFIGGPNVQGFEEEFAKFCEAKFCVGVNSGTDALRFAFLAAGIGAGESVITVPNTFIATTEAISQCGARPLFVDVDEATYNLDPQKLKLFLETECVVDGTKLMHRATNTRVVAIVPVHLYGQMADMDAILELAEKYHLKVIEDACQAHGAKYFSKKQNRWCAAGSMGLAAAFSFYPGKNLGACGEGGAATTNDEALAQRMRMIRDHGQAKKYYHDIEGYNGRLDAIQAGILRVKLPRLTAHNEHRRACAANYRTLLAPIADAVGLPFEPESSKAVYHLFVVRVGDRDGFMKQLGEAGIGTGIHYPIPLHLQKAYEGLGYKKGDFPVSERVSAEIVSLPMFPHLTEEQQQRVSNIVAEILGAKV